MVSVQPTSRAEIAQISGVVDKQLEQYGAEFLGVIRDHHASL
jgi:superfamily II DNA helicase RecQ